MVNDNKQILKKKRTNSIWKFVLILLLSINLLFYYALVTNLGYNIEVLRISFMLLVISLIINLLLCYKLFINNNNYDFWLILFSFTLLITGNLMFGYYWHNNSSYGGGFVGFIAFIPFILDIAIIDLIGGLFLRSRWCEIKHQ